MNYLAHAYLSFGNEDILVGNMISDFIKGRSKYNYPAAIQDGIGLHRAIDAFTDAHPATQTAKEFFRPYYRLYSGAFIDVVYDHFLANDSNEFSTEKELHDYVSTAYTFLEKNFEQLPVKFQGMLPYMVKQNWLYNYRYKEGIEKSFGGLSRRAKYISETDTAFTIFEHHYSRLRDCYSIFFPSVKKFARQYLDELPPA